MRATSVSLDTEQLLRTFLELVCLDSPSGEEGPVREYLIERFNALGFQGQVDAAGNLIVRVPAEQSTSGQVLVMTGHMDVVPPCKGIEPVVEGEGLERLIRSSGNTVLGADDKAALAPMLEALAYSLNEKTPRPELLFLITTREEVMLDGAKEMDPALYQNADFAIALDHTGEQGTIVVEAPSYVTFKLEVSGKSVHAGIMPEKGVNAIQILSWVLERLTFGRLDEQTTSNLGFIKGGKATNIVPDRAMVEGEIRSHDEDRIDQELAKYRAVLQEVVDPIPEASFELTTQPCFHHYRTPPEDPNVQRVIRAVETMDLPVNLIRTNGGSDVNVFAKNGLPGIVLSAGYVEPHSLNERVTLGDMVTCTQLMLAVWEQFA